MSYHSIDTSVQCYISIMLHISVQCSISPVLLQTNAMYFSPTSQRIAQRNIETAEEREKVDLVIAAPKKYLPNFAVTERKILLLLHIYPQNRAKLKIQQLYFTLIFHLNFFAEWSFLIFLFLFVFLHYVVLSSFFSPLFSFLTELLISYIPSPLFSVLTELAFSYIPSLLFSFLTELSVSCIPSLLFSFLTQLSLSHTVFILLCFLPSPGCPLIMFLLFYFLSSSFIFTYFPSPVQ